MRVTLEIVCGRASVSKFWLIPGQAATIGRTRMADYSVTDDRRMSGEHFRIECTYTHCSLRDLGSRNGTLVNGERITDKILEDGDQIQAGETTFAVAIDGAPVLAQVDLHTQADTRDSEGHAQESPVEWESEDGGKQTVPTITASDILPQEQGASPLQVRRVHLPTIRRVLLTEQLDSEQRKQIVAKPGQTLQIGRTEASDHAFPQDHRLSGVHFALHCRDRSCLVRDLESTNGTFVNKQRIDSCIVNNGDIIQAGNTKFTVTVKYSLFGASTAPDTDLPAFSNQPLPSGALRYQLQPQPRDPVDMAMLLQELTMVYVIVNAKDDEARALCRPLSPHYLYDWLPESTIDAVSPLIVNSDNISQLIPLIEQTWGREAAVCVFSREPDADLIDHLRLVARGRDGGLTPPDESHMFLECSPSGLENLIAGCSQRYARHLFSRIDAFMIEGKSQHQYTLYGGERLADLLRANGLQRAA